MWLPPCCRVRRKTSRLAERHRGFSQLTIMEDVSVQTSDDESIASENNISEVLENDDSEKNGNPKLADALAKAIRMSKSKNGKTVVLSKAKLYSQQKPITKKSHGFEIEPDPNQDIKVEVEEEDVKPVIESKKKVKKTKISRQVKNQRGRLKPSPLDREKEKPLVKIATRGVVQLFNTVRQQQSIINKQINRPGITETKKEKFLKSFDKKAFLDVLMGRNEKGGSNTKENNNVEEVKSEPEDTEEPSWEVLRDDFMMGAKLKDWDKKEMEVMEEEFQD